MKTKDKIILASLELFNEQGERSVTTNHIAADLNISPGNLYYHFRNKTDIIYEIFLQYEMLVDHYLRLPKDRALKLEDLLFYLESVFDGLWSYRFFHRDLETLLNADERLRKDYRAFTLRCLKTVNNILDGLREGGVLIDMGPEHRESMTLNVWLIVTNWMAFLKTAHAGDENHEIKKHMLKQGIYQVFSMTLPYLSAEYVPVVEKVMNRYKPDQLIPR